MTRSCSVGGNAFWRSAIMFVVHGAAVIAFPEKADHRGIFGTDPWEQDWDPRYNIAPTQPVLIIRHPTAARTCSKSGLSRADDDHIEDRTPRIGGNSCILFPLRFRNRLTVICVAHCHRPQVECLSTGACVQLWH